MKMERSMEKQRINKDLAKKLIERRIDNHNKRFLGVAGKKAEAQLIYECFNRGCFREKNIGETEESLVIKAGFRRLKDYFYLLRIGYPRIGGDVIIYEDYDLLPKGHRMHSKIPTYHFARYDFFTNKTDIDDFRRGIEISDPLI